MTFDEALGIKTSDHGSKNKEQRFEADATILCGSPPCGRGPTKVHARLQLITNLLWIVAREPDSNYGKTISEQLKKVDE